MFVHLTANEIFWRLLSTVASAFIIGLDRTERGHNAGLRTTLLISVAACLAMLQANALLVLTGKSPESFAVMDLMRLPLGILTGIGFIGGGAILRKGNVVTGVTTAATLWFMTVVGLCFGGGQLAIGWTGVAIGFVTLTVLRSFETHIPMKIPGKLIVQTESGGPTELELRAKILAAEMEIESIKISYIPHEGKTRLEWELRRNAAKNRDEVPSLIPTLSNLKGLSSVEWSS